MSNAALRSRANVLSAFLTAAGFSCRAFDSAYPGDAPNWGITVEIIPGNRESMAFIAVYGIVGDPTSILIEMMCEGAGMQEGRIAASVMSDADVLDVVKEMAKEF